MPAIEIASRFNVETSLRQIAAVVDGQNAHDPAQRPMAPSFDGCASLAAHAVILGEQREPSGYTEPISHRHRLQQQSGAKA